MIWDGEFLFVIKHRFINNGVAVDHVTAECLEKGRRPKSVKLNLNKDYREVVF